MNEIRVNDLVRVKNTNLSGKTVKVLGVDGESILWEVKLMNGEIKNYDTTELEKMTEGKIVDFLTQEFRQPVEGYSSFQKNYIEQLALEIDKIEKEIKEGKVFSQKVKEKYASQIEKLWEEIQDYKKEYERLEKEIEELIKLFKEKGKFLKFELNIRDWQNVHLENLKDGLFQILQRYFSIINKKEPLGFVSSQYIENEEEKLSKLTNLAIDTVICYKTGGEFWCIFEKINKIRELLLFIFT